MDIVLNKQKFLEAAKSAIAHCDEDLISRAWDLARDSHIDQKRESGESFFSHPVGVAFALLDINCDSCTIAAALLHDVVEDTSVGINEIEQRFGKEVAALVNGLTKLAPLDTPPPQVWTSEKSRRDNLRKLFVSIADDPRVAAIKLADRLHNLASLGALAEDRRLRIARESLDVFAPLAEALGLGIFQSRIQDLAFRYLEPDIYKELESKIQERRVHFETVQALAIEQIEDAMDAAGIKGDVHGRQKQIYSIYCKMKALDLDFEDVYDIIGIRVIVGSEEDCYRTKYVVDQLGKEVKYDDYIDVPREPLGYQSLHKVVIDSPGGVLIEVQIRTHEMHERAEHGAAAHWVYKIVGKSKPDSILIKRIAELREILATLGDSVADAQSDTASMSLEELFEAIREEGLAARIQVFTPNGDVVSLPAGATPIDLAYHIHTQLGHECIGAKINGKSVPLDYKLKDGDTVEILKRRGSSPKLGWLAEGKVKSSRARQKIRQYFRDQERPEAITYGRKIVQQRLRSLREYSIELQDVLDVFIQMETGSGKPTSEGLYLAVAEGRISIDRFNKIIGRLLVERSLAAKSLPRDSTRNLARWFASKGVISGDADETLFLGIAEGDISRQQLDQAIYELSAQSTDQQAIVLTPQPIGQAKSGHMLATLAQCCYPVPGDAIVSYVTIGYGYKVHRATCPNVLMPSRQDRTQNGINWQDLGLSLKTGFQSELFVMLSESNPEIDRKIQETTSKAKGVIRAFTPMGTSKKYLSQIRLLIAVNDLQHLNQIRERLRQLREVLDVRRSFDD
ncbi:GTP pyrophosphokinase [Anaerolineae bacterium]|nr:GTP pyrophosphokinase [Anaerolineae bacterium]